ncbi:rubrerythrin family protein [Infirmifilum sp. NZ]|nr:rubrerythrin family protein [Infirmifilum sp. NZ]UNQ73541.1 rubrerythrin family protein [Infirmifilum sp. NZ]
MILPSRRSNLTIKEVLVNALSGESMVHTRYLVFVDTSERGSRNVARLFKAIGFAELVHTGNHYSNLRGLREEAKVSAGLPIGPGNTSRNLEIGIMGETFEVNEIYPAYIAIARSQGEKEAERSFTWALEAEKIHAELYSKRRSTSTKARTCP